jgi:ubiquinol oxidase
MQTYTIQSFKYLKQKPPVSTRCQLPADYGYQRFTKIETENDKIPKSFVQFAFENARKEIFQKRYGFRNDPYNQRTNPKEISLIRNQRMYLKRLCLDNDNIWMREHQRETVPASRIVLTMYYSICFVLDVIYKDKPIERFWFLETIARMPYFSYVAVLYMYESLGFWEIDGQLKRIHLNEEINEAQHLRIMESIGGDALWWNRFIARHVAMVYYVVLVVLFMASPRTAYMSSELLERHAVDTYEEFAQANKNILMKMPLTQSALDYLPEAKTFYEVFTNIANDERTHAETMRVVRNMRQ